MKHNTLHILSIFILMAIIVSACNMPGTGVTTPTQEPAKTQIPATNTQPSLPPTREVTLVPASPTSTSQPTATNTPVPTATNSPTPTSSACTDLAKFVTDVSVPDNTEMLPGQAFTKTWRLQNVGTCTWTKQYALTFISGDQMSGTSPVPLSDSIAPNATLDISASLKAPGTTGTYRGDWNLKNSSGAPFGIGTHASDSFYVQIKVIEGVSELNLGTATWTDNLDNANNWYLLDTANTKFTHSDSKLVLTSITPGAGEEWGLSDRPSMKDYYLQATFITGGSCSGYDKYGLLARAPDQDKGYVFEFSCDGHFRLYTWDGKNYNAVQEWHASDSIVAGANQTNVMGIYMKGTDIRLYANGHKLGEFTDSTFDHGQFGVVIGSVNTQNFTVSVDQVSYWDFTP
jgi:hypothetical protein